MPNNIYVRLSDELRAVVQSAAKAGDPHPQEWSPERMLSALGCALDIPFICLRAENVDIDSFKKHHAACTRLRFLPLFESGIVIVAATPQPWSEASLRALRKELHMEVRLVGVTDQDFDRALTIMEERRHFCENPSTNEKPRQTPAAILTGWDIRPGEPMAVVKDIIRKAHAFGASDIILDPMENRLDVRMRILGSVEVMPPISFDHMAGILNQGKIMAGIAVEETRGFRSGRAELELAQNYRLSLRVESQPTPHGDALVMRLLDPMSIRRNIGILPFHGADLELVQACMGRDSGIIFVTGPTGSGKTTTLYRCLTSLDLSGLNVRTIEDPIEYLVDKIVQTAVSPTAGFSAALRSMLRADPDVILVGEIRDTETASVAIEASLTGHLIFSTLHTKDAVAAIPRLADLGVSPFLIGQTISLVVAQRLAGKLCTCKISQTPSERITRHFDRYGIPTPEKVYERCGCRNCNGSGFVGRIPIFEMFYVDDELRDVIQSGQMEKIRPLWRQKGGRPLAQSGLLLVADGLTSYDEVSLYETGLF